MKKQLDLFTQQSESQPEPAPKSLTLTPTIRIPDTWQIGDRVQVKATYEVGTLASIMSDRWLVFVDFEHRDGFYYPHSELLNLEEHPPAVREQPPEPPPPAVREQPPEPIENEALSMLPNQDWKTNGYVEVKQIKGHLYRYWRWREGRILKSRYLGKAIGASPPVSE